MKCDICGFEYEGIFCPKCGWEEMNILDDEYLEIFNKRKEIYKKRLSFDKKFEQFMENLILKYNVYLKSNPAMAKVFINDICEILKDIDKKYYIEFLLAKFYLFITTKDKNIEPILQELETLEIKMNEEQKNNFKKLKELYEKSF
jgi:hypothetical protein